LLCHDSSLIANFVTDDAANRCTTHSTHCAAAGEHCTTHRANTGTDRRAFVPFRHTGATRKAKQHCCRDRTEDQLPYHSHDLSPKSDEAESDIQAPYAGSTPHISKGLRAISKGASNHCTEPLA